MKKTQRVVALIFAFLFSLLVSSSVQAQEVNPVTRIEPTITSISPRADVIVMKYRIYKGVIQCRRWNETWGYWVDPDWIDLW